MKDVDRRKHSIRNDPKLRALAQKLMSFASDFGQPISDELAHELAYEAFEEFGMNWL